MKNKLLFLSMLALSTMTSCKKDEEDTTTPPASDAGYSTGAYVVNEGAFLQNNASITHISENDQVTNDVYYTVNNVELGDVMQSFTIIGDRGYAVINNSQKVTAVDLKTMEFVADIEGLSYPRYMVRAGNGKAYVSNGSMTGTLEVVNLSTHEITGNISVGTGPGKMAVNGNEVWVCNEGGWSLDSTITIVDANSNTVSETITIGHRPSSLVFDAFGYAWVLCAGETFYDENWAVVGNSAAKLVRVDVSTHQVVAEIQVGSLGDHPTQLTISPDQTTLYYENNGVYAYDLVNGDFPGNLLIAESRSALSVHPYTGEIWCASISDFSSPSNVYVYSTTGTLQKTFTCGIASNAVVFR
ncbi:MAG: YncE family protein [Flavobacteriales bacterium]|jgi:Tfp pilus assembly major pilin PilA